MNSEYIVGIFLKTNTSLMNFTLKAYASSTVYKKNTKLWVWVGYGDGGGS